MSKFKDISTSVPRHDAADKISGKTEYLNDMKVEGVLWAKTFRSTIAKGKIKSIKYPELPEGYYIIDYRDVPGENIVKIIENDMPIFARNRVNYIGEPILLIVGENRECILNILDGIIIEYQVQDGFFDVEEVLRGELPSNYAIFNEDNLFADYKMNRGDVLEGLNESVATYEGIYSTGYQEHFYLETQSVMGVYENGEILVYGSMQCPYYVKGALVQALGMDENKVNVIQTTTGGAFGGKEEYPSQLAAQVAVAALKCKAPVKLIFDRDEDVEFTTKRHPSRVKIRGGVDNEGKLNAIDIEILLDSGAYAGLSKVILQRAMFASTAAYYVPILRVRGKSVATNTVVGGAYRGFGAPQTIFAFERFMDEFALELNKNPNEFRRNNFIKQGDLSCTDGKFREHVPLENMYKRIHELTESAKSEETFSDKKIGVGYSFFYHGCGFTGSGEKDHIKAEVALVKKDTKVEVLISNVEMGQGASVTLRKIVAHTLEIPIEDVIFENPDTRVVPDSGPTVASRTIMIVGKLLFDAAADMKERWGECNFKIRKNYVHPKGFNWDEDTFKGDAYNSYSWGTNAVQVEVDELTLEVTIKNVWSIFDIGKAIDTRIVMGQIDGGVAQGLGYAGLENMVQKDGKIKQKTSTDYIIPTSMDLPNMYKELYDNPYELGPYGAKGLGEITFVGVPVAYANAVADALSVKVKEIPITPEKLICEEGL